VNTYRWTPKEIDELYCDDMDHHGIIYWYKEVERQQDALKDNK